MAGPTIRMRSRSAILLGICVVIAMFAIAFTADRQSASYKNTSVFISKMDRRFIGSWRDQSGAIWEFNAGGIGRKRLSQRNRVHGFTWQSEESPNQLVVTEGGNGLLEGISALVLGKEKFVLSVDSVTEQEMRLSFFRLNRTNQLVLIRESEANRISSSLGGTKR